VEGSLIGVWYYTLAKDGQTYDLRIDVDTDGNPAHDLHSNVVTVLIDNTPPQFRSILIWVPDFPPGATFTGNFSAVDIHFRSFQFEVLPSGPARGVLPFAGLRWVGLLRRPARGSWSCGWQLHAEHGNQPGPASERTDRSLRLRDDPECLGSYECKQRRR
jgi:hypothetical protein